MVAAMPRRLNRVDSVPRGVSRTWLAPQYWANRLADWRLSGGRLECVTAGVGGRTVGVLTRSIPAGDVSGSLSVRTGTLAAGPGFSGFVVGTGAGDLDWRAAALVAGPSGIGGGLLAVYDSSGRVQFREHTDESNQFAYAVLPSDEHGGPAPARTLGEDVELRLDITSVGDNHFDLVLTASSMANGALLSTARRTGVPGRHLAGGISLISATREHGTSARHWLRELATGGAKVAEHARSAGPVLGTLYSVSGTTLKLSAQFMPIGDTDPQRATLQIRATGTTTWRPAATARIGAGFVALFRIAGWDASQAWDYRVAYAVGTSEESFYAGIVRRDPGEQDTVSIGMVNCTIHSYRSLDKASRGRQRLPGERYLGLYTKDNLYFPYQEMVRNLRRQSPDLLVALGDQYYETRPTDVDRRNAVLDMLGRYYLWLWSFGELTRQTPTICLVDDHDVYHGNLWGWSGSPAPGGDQSFGGYVMPASWVNTVQRVQCGHNPDAYDPTPVHQGISVYYSAFSYGGVSFCVLEDRKFKNTNQHDKNRDGEPLPKPRDLLGSRQEDLLVAWKGMHPGQPKVCLTQTLFGCVQTDPDGGPRRDFDSNGAPVGGRRHAIRLIEEAHALVLSGDQHLGSLVRHGRETFTDGPVQFTAPAAGTAWQRWFQPRHPLPNANGPDTGDFTDGFGNNFRVLAVANPRITLAQVRAVKGNNRIGDRELKREGYGIVIVDKARGAFVIECWPWREDPTAPAAVQYPGWPYTLPFASA